MTELKNAIITVITVTYKYEAPAAFDTVKKAGYEIYKNNGVWVVRNRKTYKTVSIIGAYGHGVYIGNRRIKIEDIGKVDIVNYLNTPYNHAYRNAVTWETPTQRKVRELRYAKKNVKYHDDKIAQLLKEIEREREYQKKAVEELTVLRVKNGLRK